MVEPDTTSPPVPKDAVASLAGQLRHADTGTAARLRRFHPSHDGRAALFEAELLLHAAQVHPHDEAQRQRWALVLHCLAIAQGAHDPRAEPGAALARLHFSEARLRQLVEADEAVLADLVPRIARRLAAAGAVVNWRPLADLLLYAGVDEMRADQARRRLVDHYLRAQQPAATALAAD